MDIENKEGNDCNRSCLIFVGTKEVNLVVDDIIREVDIYPIIVVLKKGFIVIVGN